MKILESEISTKAEYGKCVYNNKELFFKRIFNKDMFLSEIKGYDAVCNCLKGPKRVAVDYDSQTIFYEYIENIDNKLLQAYLYYPLRRPCIKYLQNQLDNFVKLDEEDCPNINYFKYRLHFLDDYAKKIEILNKPWIVNDKVFQPLEIFKSIKENLSKEKQVLAFLTQGDPSAVNILNDGRIIDYEIAGYNCVVGEVAIFIITMLYSGYYFFIKYANGEYLNFKNVYEKNKHRIKVDYSINDKVIVKNHSVNFPKKNRKLAIEYINRLLNILKKEELKEIENILKYYLAFRLLTPKNLIEMEEADIVLTIALVIDIMENANSFESLIKKIKS